MVEIYCTCDQFGRVLYIGLIYSMELFFYRVQNFILSLKIQSTTASLMIKIFVSLHGKKSWFKTTHINRGFKLRARFIFRNVEIVIWNRNEMMNWRFGKLMWPRSRRGLKRRYTCVLWNDDISLRVYGDLKVPRLSFKPHYKRWQSCWPNLK